MSDPNPARVVRHLQSVLGTDAGEGDGVLLARYADHGDDSAFELLVWRHAGFVQRICFAVLRDHHSAEDACQAAFLVLARKAGRLRGSTSVVGWLYRVSRRIAVKSAVRRKERGASIELDDIPAGVSETETDADTMRLIHDEIARLPERYRVPIIVCLIEGLTHAEAAARLGWPIGSVAGRLARAKQLLERRLSRRGVAAAAAVLATNLAPTGAAAVQPAFVAATLTAALAYASGRLVGSSVSLDVLNLSNGELKAMLTTRLLTVVVAGTVIGLAAAGATLAQKRTPHVPPDSKPIPVAKTAEKPAELIVGRWQGPGREAKTLSVDKKTVLKEYTEKVNIEFGKDGSFNYVAEGIPEMKQERETMTGTYRFISDTEFELDVKRNNGAKEKSRNKVKVTQDELTLTEADEDQPRTSTFKRVK